jgi:HEAT repeats
MTFFCWKCFAEIESLSAICRSCGAAQDSDHFTYTEKLRGALTHPLAETRRRAIFLIGEKRIAEAVDDLSRVIAGKSDPFLAEEAAIALGKIGNESALYALTAAARHRSFIVRARALEALRGAGGYWARLARNWARGDPSAVVRRGEG